MASTRQKVAFNETFIRSNLTTMAAGRAGLFSRNRQLYDFWYTHTLSLEAKYFFLYRKIKEPNSNVTEPVFLLSVFMPGSVSFTGNWLRRRAARASFFFSFLLFRVLPLDWFNGCFAFFKVRKGVSLPSFKLTCREKTFSLTYLLSSSSSFAAGRSKYQWRNQSTQLLNKSQEVKENSAVYLFCQKENDAKSEVIFLTW